MKALLTALVFWLFTLSAFGQSGPQSLAPIDTARLDVPFTLQKGESFSAFAVNLVSPIGVNMYTGGAGPNKLFRHLNKQKPPAAFIAGFPSCPLRRVDRACQIRNYAQSNHPSKGPKAQIEVQWDNASAPDTARDNTYHAHFQATGPPNFGGLGRSLDCRGKTAKIALYIFYFDEAKQLKRRFLGNLRLR